MNFPKRVPVLANPHDGNSMRKVSRAAKTLSLVDESMQTSLTGRLQSIAWPVTVFLGQCQCFAMRNVIQTGRSTPLFSVIKLQQFPRPQMRADSSLQVDIDPRRVKLSPPAADKAVMSRSTLDDTDHALTISVVPDRRIT